uniref:Pentraxin family member n=1 Tax=Sinocyclocheilus anshuiensis TaxID=1608454 RepID=A0A671KIT0_9TELE
WLAQEKEVSLSLSLFGRLTHVEVSPKTPFKTNAVTICLWVKPTQVLNKTILFSYSTTGNAYELQLVLNGQSVFFTVDGETHLVQASGAAREGQWVHICAVWSSQQGLASLWVNGQQAASSPGVAEGHELRSKGSILLGQEYGRLFRHLSIPDTFDAELAFTGKMTGVNMWDRVLDSKEISQQQVTIVKLLPLEGHYIIYLFFIITNCSVLQECLIQNGGI